ncbi:MAG: Crp/Fnr family transcriptional regulator [Nitrospirae bacterium]|nr:Crp/Fnr family transcriptional regulator [Nitrospirota bacterium]
MQIIKQNPSMAIDLLGAVVKRLRETNAKVESLVFYDVDERLVRLLLQIAIEQGEKINKGFYKIKKITQKDIGSRIGASRESVSKALKILAMSKKVVEADGYFLVRSDVVSNL